MESAPKCLGGWARTQPARLLACISPPEDNENVIVLYAAKLTHASCAAQSRGVLSNIGIFFYGAGELPGNKDVYVKTSVNAIIAIAVTHATALNVTVFTYSPIKSRRFTNSKMKINTTGSQKPFP